MIFYLLIFFTILLVIDFIVNFVFKCIKDKKDNEYHQNIFK